MANSGNKPSPAPRPSSARPSRLRAYAESRGAAFVACGVIILGQAWLSHALGFRPFWLFPAISACLLVGSVVVYRSDLEEPTLPMRLFSWSVVGVLTFVDVILLVLLIRGVFVGSVLDPQGLLFAGLVLWVVNTAVFALGYWEIDGGGPEDRARDSGNLPDLVFPQQQADQQGLAPPDWTPEFSDYLYVSVTASTAFSPTDAMPYSRTAKLIMGVESTLSFAIVAMLIARAVNIAKG